MADARRSILDAKRVFVVTAPLCAVLWWWLADWHVHVRDEPKFVIPVSWQIGESAIVGLAIGGALAGIVSLGRRWFRVTMPGTPT